MIIFNFLKKIILQLILFLSFVFPIKSVQTEQKKEIIIDQLVLNKKISSDESKLILENNEKKDKIINYGIKIPNQVKNDSDSEKNQESKYPFFKIINKVAGLFETCISGFLGIIGGYIAQKVINQIDENEQQEKQ
ncbi:MAG: hypothetical protein J6P21_02560 [Clostridia bacterium]|nr:hypothetical protein [Clostridia bacterium]